MKQIILLLSFVIFVTLTQAQSTTIYFETCGVLAVPSNPRISVIYEEGTYAGWDVGLPVTYTSSNNESRLRETPVNTNHIFFPADIDSDFIISNISAVGYTNLKLSFDVAAHRLLGDANAVSVSVNGTELVGIPSQTLWEINTFVTVADIPIPDADVISLKFKYSASTNTLAYRLDNFKITGDVVSGIKTASADELNIQVAGNKLTISNVSDSAVEIFNTLGAKVSTLELVEGSSDLNLNRGIYILRAGKKSAKILL